MVAWAMPDGLAARCGPHMKKDGLPVLVKVERNHVRTTRMVKEEPVVRTGSSLEMRIDALHPALRRSVGQYKCSCLPKLHNNTKVAVATDGSVKHFRGGASVVIDDGEGGRFISTTPVDGNLDDMDSFRAELVGILSAVVVINLMLQLEKDEGIKGTVDIKLWTDSQASTVAINTMETTTSWSHQRSLIKEISIISEIRHHLNHLPSIDIRWVEAHQQTLNTRGHVSEDAAWSKRCVEIQVSTNEAAKSGYSDMATSRCL